MRSLLFRVTLLLAAVTLSACSSTYYAAWKKLGYEKRDILVSRVKEVRNDQQAAKEQFQTTLQRFRAVAGTPEDSLQKRYDKLSADYDSCESRAKAVHERVASVDKVANDLFAEWQTELGQYQSQDLRRASEKELHDTQARYAQLIAAMRRAEDKMQPVLTAFHDQVLYLKHNLNARAIASLQTTQAGIESDVSALIRDMDNSIAEANAFISDMQKSAN